ncbi:hypothetical protein HAP48_0024100 [Bradyrhizobium septentrionale]|uniref:Uncharacterized protein n=1 Tax=Bradyrhizobium septentrionale TaxID=1404411 RepID=A0A974A0C5_9BRAD|nr:MULTISPECIES: hypothetical protein [Bradyrhizobium]MCK7672779.1 hypothetical protein [Bradyrhizobium sp. 2S1]UGY20239.1 hypothetical protein HAP48_0024100 [Bradyrhizobium septentrionale]UGY29082.1 hypothetical protein HU675_0021450 [Bradyrhizobium septentrionale]
MSPLEAISRWLESQDLDTQLEVAAYVTFSIFRKSDVLTLGGPEELDTLQRWLTEPELDPRAAAGRALTFRLAFEYFAEGRIRGDGWKRTEELERKSLELAKRDGKLAAARKAQRKLQLLPTRKEHWYRVAKSWNGLAATYLTREALALGSLPRCDLKAISNSHCLPLVPTVEASDAALVPIVPATAVEEGEEGRNEVLFSQKSGQS